MRRHLLVALVVVLGVAAPAGAQVIYGPLRPMANTLVHTDSGGNLGITGDVVCTSGCSGGTTDTDDGTVAGGQSTGLAINLAHLWNGVSWVRMPGDATNGLKVQGPQTDTEFKATAAGSQGALSAGTLAATTAAAALGTGAIVQVLVQNDPDNTVDVLCGSSAAQPIQLKPGDGLTLNVTNLNVVQCKTVSSTATVNYVAR